MSGTRYVCTGSSGKMFTKKEYEQGKNRCASEGCEKKGQPLEKREYCPECATVFNKEEGHTCGGSSRGCE